MLDLIQSWIGVRSADICPIHNWSKTDKPSTIGGRIKTDTSPNAPDKTDTTPKYNRQTTDNLSWRDLSNMFERSLPDKFVCPNINRHQNWQNRINTDCKPNSPRIWGFLSVWGRFCVGLAGVTEVLVMILPHDGNQIQASVTCTKCCVDHWVHSTSLILAFWSSYFLNRMVPVDEWH